MAARLRDPVSGRIMEIHTDAPGIQFCAGRKLDRPLTGKQAIVYRPNTGVCLETQA